MYHTSTTAGTMVYLAGEVKNLVAAIEIIIVFLITVINRENIATWTTVILNIPMFISLHTTPIVAVGPMVTVTFTLATVIIIHCHTVTGGILITAMVF